MFDDGNYFLRKDKTVCHKLLNLVCRNYKTVQVIVLQNIFCSLQLKRFFFFECKVLSDCSRLTHTSRQSIDHPTEWGSRVSRRGLTLYLLMWFWSILIRAVRAVCRHEAQPEYTNPAAAWHRTHTLTLSQKTKVTVSASLHGRRQEKINEMKEYGNK